MEASPDSEGTDLAYFPEGTRTRRVRLASGLNVRVYERGERGETVLCLHGFPELAVSWRFQFEQLSGDYQVVAPDLRGYGGTDAPTRVRDYSLAHLRADVGELLDVLEVDRVHLVGHDWGGAIAWSFAMHHADRLLSLAVLNCPPVQLMFRSAMRPAQLRRSWYIFAFQVPGIGERILLKDPRKSVTRMFRGTAYVPDPFDDRALEPYVRQFRDRGLPGLKYYRAVMRRRPGRLVQVSVATRLIWGRHDHALGPWFADPTAYEPFVPRFDRVLLDAGHWVQQEAADDVCAALREHWRRCAIPRV
jgi:pimeloyl-ACP methyl ester carboxylesterase